jgi:hypothetical protein
MNTPKPEGAPRCDSISPVSELRCEREAHHLGVHENGTNKWPYTTAQPAAIAGKASAETQADRTARGDFSQWPAPAEPSDSAAQSRSVQRRVAMQKGEQMPTFTDSVEETLANYIAAADVQHELLKVSFNHLSKDGPTRSNVSKATQLYRDTRFKMLQAREGQPALASTPAKPPCIVPLGCYKRGERMCPINCRCHCHPSNAAPEAALLAEESKL